MKKITQTKSLFTRNRAAVISLNDINKTYYVYNGKQAIPVTVQKQHIGYKLGEFSITKKLGKRIHDSERNRKKKLKKKNKK